MRPERRRRDNRPVVALLQSGLIGIGAVTLAVLVVAGAAAVIALIVAGRY
jgi:hypothetical protein